MEDAPLLRSIHQFQQHVRSHGMADLRQVATDSLQDMCREPLHVAVLGRQNQQKTKFINGFTTLAAFGSLSTPDLFRQNIADVEHSSGDAKSTMKRAFSDIGLTSVRFVPDGTIVSKNRDSMLSEISDEGVFVSDEEVEFEQLSSDIPVAVFPTTASPTPSFRGGLTDIVLHDITEEDTKNLTDTNKCYGYDVFITFSASRYVNDDMLRWMRMYRGERHVLYVNTCLDHRIETRRQDSHRSVHSYFRQKLFRHHLWSVPMYIISNIEPGLYDYPDLHKQMTKFQRRKARHRRRLLRTAAIDAIPQNGFTQSGQIVAMISALASSENALTYPILPVGADLLSGLAQWYGCKKYFGREDARDPKADCDTENTADKIAKLVLEKAPALVTWCIQRSISRLASFITDDNIVRTFMVGVGSIFGYHLTRKAHRAHSDRCTRDATWCINATMNSSLSDGFVAASSASSRATSRRSSFIQPSPSTPSLANW